ncbi:MAG: 3-oxoacyl-[acyl-carrier-protein] reductase [Deltaproteobacteria bacterium]
MELNGKVALITGAAQGIGKSIALVLARNGADIAVSDVNLEKAEEAAREIQGLGRKAIAIKGNVAAVADAEKMVEEAIAGLGKVDILVNNAGITRDGLMLRMKEEDWDLVIDINLKGVFNCSKAAVKHMAKQRYGRIVNIASIVGEMGNAGQANYSASKGGVIALTKTVAREFAGRNVNVNAVAPGFIKTAMTDALPDAAREALTKQIPLDRLGSPEDVANAVLFLVSDASSYITGQVINVNGGMYM